VTIIASIIKAVVMNVIDIDVVDDYFHSPVALYPNFNSNKQVANP
jgi:hypothetical protein